MPELMATYNVQCRNRMARRLVSLVISISATDAGSADAKRRELEKTDEDYNTRCDTTTTPIRIMLFWRKLKDKLPR
jgi:hypothetical protein